MFCLSAAGESMEPALCTGAVIFVDPGRNLVDRQDIFVFTLGDDVFLK